MPWGGSFSWKKAGVGSTWIPGQRIFCENVVLSPCSVLISIPMRDLKAPSRKHSLSCAEKTHKIPPAAVLPAVIYALTFNPGTWWAHCSCCRLEWPSSHFLTQPPPCLPLLNKCSQLAHSLTRLLATWPPESPSLPAHSFCSGRAHPTKWHFYTDTHTHSNFHINIMGARRGL